MLIIIEIMLCIQLCEQCHFCSDKVLLLLACYVVLDQAGLVDEEREDARSAFFPFAPFDFGIGSLHSITFSLSLVLFNLRNKSRYIHTRKIAYIDK